MVEWQSPDKSLTAMWRWGGELWMSGPEWGYLSLGRLPEIKGALPDILWSADSQLLAFVSLHVQDVPKRQGTEGFSFRVGVIRVPDLQLRYCLGNQKLAEIKLLSLTAETLTATVNGELKSVALNNIRWSAFDAEA